jgi:hypothetical protein
VKIESIKQIKTKRHYNNNLLAHGEAGAKLGSKLAIEIGRPKSPFASAKRAWLFKGKGGHCLSQACLASLAAALKSHV